MRILWLLMGLILVHIVGALECQREMITTDIPCTIYSSWKPEGVCDTELKIFSSNGEVLQETKWQNGIPFCNFTFNISEKGTYIYNSTIDDGVIVIEQEDNMLSIILLQIFLVAFFVLLGIPHKVGFIKTISWGLAIIELLISVWIVYINEMGEDITTLLYTNAISVLIIGGLLGFITLFVIMVRLMNIEKDKTFEEDTYTKWMYK